MLLLLALLCVACAATSATGDELKESIDFVCWPSSLILSFYSCLNAVIMMGKANT